MPKAGNHYFESHLFPWQIHLHSVFIASLDSYGGLFHVVLFTLEGTSHSLPCLSLCHTQPATVSPAGSHPDCHALFLSAIKLLCSHQTYLPNHFNCREMRGILKGSCATATKPISNSVSTIGRHVASLGARVPGFLYASYFANSPVNEVLLR